MYLVQSQCYRLIRPLSAFLSQHLVRKRGEGLGWPGSVVIPVAQREVVDALEAEAEFREPVLE
jgi:hypothetical protein